MGTPADLLTRKAAAAILEVSQRTLSNYVEQGLLQKVARERKVFFQRVDVTALKEVLRGGKDLASVAHIAMRAFIRAEQNEKKLNDLLNLLGFTTIVLDTNPAAVTRLIERAQDMSELIEPCMNASELFHFAKELFAMTENYLRLIAHHSSSDEPWRVFLNAAENLCRLAPTEKLIHDHELATAYSYITTARRHVRSVAYHYVREEHGKGVADEAFLGDNAFDPIITTIFPN